MESFPRQQARSRRFALGAPRDAAVSADGGRVAFLRSPAGDDPATELWVLDVGTGERLVAAPGQLLATGMESAEERARRERRRERAEGIVAYGADTALSRAAFTLGGQLWVADLDRGGAIPAAVPGPVFDPRLDPTGGRVAWCAGGDLWVADAADPAGTARRVAGEEAVEITWGQAEFVAAEEMGRDRGYWWAPDGSALLATRVDVGPVARWWVSDPAYPDREPSPMRYPAAGTADADVTLWLLGAGGTRLEVAWDRQAFPYLASVSWPAVGNPLLVVERRDHRRAEVLVVDPHDGGTDLLASIDDPAWVDWPAGLPSRLDDGRLVWTQVVDDTRTLSVDAEPVTPSGLQVRAVHHTGAAILFSAWREPSQIELWRWSPAGLEQLDGSGVVVWAAAGPSTAVVARRDLDSVGTQVRVESAGAPAVLLESRVEAPSVQPVVRIERFGPRDLRGAVLLPAGHPAGTKLPVLLHPYGGPGAQRVLCDRHAWLESQWWADQGFAVVVADGRGTPGRGPAWERTVHLDLATAVLEDQVDALHAAAAAHPELDLGRVGISGWSFGGYLAALAVLRRPEVFHAAVAGAPVTDWTLYDTYYTERFLGHPGTDPAPYQRSSLLTDAPGLRRPLLLVHGMVDDNVVVGHTIRLSQHLTAHGRSHAVLPLTGMTHFSSAEDIAEHLLRLQREFLRDALAD